jgi:hypothetical protein
MAVVSWQPTFPYPSENAFVIRPLKVPWNPLPRLVVQRSYVGQGAQPTIRANGSPAKRLTNCGQLLLAFQSAGRRAAANPCFWQLTNDGSIMMTSSSNIEYASHDFGNTWYSPNMNGMSTGTNTNVYESSAGMQLYRGSAGHIFHLNSGIWSKMPLSSQDQFSFILSISLLRMHKEHF